VSVLIDQSNSFRKINGDTMYDPFTLVYHERMISAV